MSITLEAVKKGIAFIEANLQHNIGVSDVADAVSYSQFYFSREFTRHTHISIYDYILRRKISEAYKCLIATDVKIVDLAFRYGFQSHEVFTRAFRKMFGENPSEAVLYKPLAVYEAIDEPYLDFLRGLKTEVMGEQIQDLFFEVDTGEELANDGSALMLLGKSSLYRSITIFKGRTRHSCDSGLSFRLSEMRAKLRLYHTDEERSFRYFFEHAYDVDEMGGNYILARKGSNYIDLLIPAKADKMRGV